MNTEPSKAREGLDLLLRLHPFFEVLKVEWQDDGPWVLVELGLRGESAVTQEEAFLRFPWAIWKHTGAIYGYENVGEVKEDPTWEPGENEPPRGIFYMAEPQ